jgi:hypothetical protein
VQQCGSYAWSAAPCCPELPTEYFLDSLREPIAADGDWVPTAPDTSFTCAPFMFAKEASSECARRKRSTTT